jgi:hypothetical protein
MNLPIVVFSILLTAGVFPRASKQTTQEMPNDLFRKIPADQREALREGVQRLIEAEKKGDWKTVFELGERRPGQTADSFASERKRRRPLRDFVPASLTFIPPDEEWVIEGCASVEGDRKSLGHISTIHARWKDSRWFVSEIAVAPSEKGLIRECSMPASTIPPSTPTTR